MNELTKIFDGQELRIIEMDNEPWFVLYDLVNILELSNSRMVKKRLGDDVSTTYPISDSMGRTQQATIVNEDGLYDVILDSRKPEAKQFRKWVTSEVIPSIRKHGTYMTPETIEQALTDPDTIIKIATDLKEEKSKRAKAESQIEADKPYTNFGRIVSNSNATVSIGAFAKMLYDEHGIVIGRNRLFSWLRDNGYLIKSGREKNVPKQKYIEQGLFDTKVTVISKTDQDIEKATALITGKGQVRIAQELLETYESFK
ncbi:phage antirepressor [Alkalibacillus salilacus]|uniref:Anti-repressor protein n=1 Tax=Alkalibacillus salilacus TaxID=284582 RepID=A0ABT9VDK0_9BACI|nr:phage antirepressor [Alkalibacillus salilacus]MDQ0159001.1 anti-repressor protein [Alkalibacillus salilacus]